jgi:integrase
LLEGWPVQFLETGAISPVLFITLLTPRRLRLVFCTSKGTPYNSENIVKWNFAKVLKDAEAQRAKDGLPAIGKVRWHDLRHTFGSLKIDQGEDLLYISRQMGHSSLSVTGEIYAHQIREHRPEAAAKTDLLIFG